MQGGCGPLQEHRRDAAKSEQQPEHELKAASTARAKQLLLPTLLPTASFASFTVKQFKVFTPPGAPPPTPAALPIANTRPQRASLAATTAAIQNSVQKLAATTRLGVKKKTYQN